MPNLFLIGVPKAGTTSIYNLLKHSTEIYCPKIKEPHFLSLKKTFDGYIPKYAVDTEDKYLDLFKESTGKKWKLDASVTYIYASDTMLDLTSNTNNKFIICLRKPSDATKSMIRQRLKSINPTKRDENYYKSLIEIDNHGARMSYPPGCFSKILFNYKDLYDYKKIIPNLFQILDKKRLIIVYFEELQQYPESVVQKLSDFLDVDLNIANVRKENVSYEIVNSDFTKLYKKTYTLMNKYLRHEVLENNVFERILRKFLKTQKTEIDLSDIQYLHTLDAYYEFLRSNSPHNSN